MITGWAWFKENQREKKNLRRRDEEKEGKRESSWVGGKHLAVVEAWP